MKANTHSINKLKGNKILIIVECLSGAIKASHFALKYLYKDNDPIILLQVYKVQGLGCFMMRNISPILKEIALKDLSILEKIIIREFGISKENIQKLVYEEDLSTTIRGKQFTDDNLIVVIGEDQNFLNHKVSHKNISTVLKAINEGTIYYVEDNITVINRSKIIVISEEPNKIDEASKIFIKSISRMYGTDIVHSEVSIMNDKFLNGNPL